MFQRRSRRFRRRTNGRSRPPRHNDNGQPRVGNNSFSNGQSRNNFRGNNQSAEKLFEKYSALAKEALSSGDKTLSENYYQHADHFMRIIEDKNKNFTSNKAQDNKKLETEENNPATGNITDSENTTKEKEE